MTLKPKKKKRQNIFHIFHIIDTHMSEMNILLGMSCLRCHEKKIQNPIKF